MWNDTSIQPDMITYTNILMACAAVGSEEALRIGTSVLKALEHNKIKADTQLDMAIFTMFCNCGAPDRALKRWTTLSHKSTASSMIQACALRACGLIGPRALQQGKDIHKIIAAQGHIVDANIYAALLQMYTR
jgi:hypothetical protein